jgi:hypothetical protein
MDPTDSKGLQMMESNIEIMNQLNGFNVVIICCSQSQQARYWQKRLEEGRGSVLPLSSIVLAVQEDWPGGAGNALGTLYAYKNAVALASERNGIDIDGMLKAGEISIGLYHTAGKGTRLAPLPGAENNNKPGVKVPATVKIGNSIVPMTILEAVIKQTGCYSSSRMGRLSVFWGDQVFIPTVPVAYTVTHHVDILCSLGPMLSEEEWKEKGMEKYGLIAQGVDGSTAQVEKVDHATANQLLADLGKITSVGVSLGSFSVSNKMLFALLEEFSAELARRKGKLDSDPHLWMPMTLSRDAYIHLMGQKDIDAQSSGAHFDRIQTMLAKFHLADDKGPKKLGLFGPVNVGEGVCWWDYGQLKLYQRNALLLAERSTEAELMRLFFGLSSSRVRDSAVVKTDVDNTSCLSSCHIGKVGRKHCGSIKNSVLCNVKCNNIDADGCILINVTADSIIAKPGSVIYNIVDDSTEGLDVNNGQVLAGVFSPDGSQMLMKSTTNIDGGRAWERQLEWNPKTFEDVYKMNTDANPIDLERSISLAHTSRWGDLSQPPARRLSTSGQGDITVAADMAKEAYWTGYGAGFSAGLLGALSVVGLVVTTKIIMGKNNN